MKGEKIVSLGEVDRQAAALWEALALAVCREAALRGCAAAVVLDVIADVVMGAQLDTLAQAVVDVGGRGGKVRNGRGDGAWDGFLTDEVRRAHGVHFTPDSVADGLVRHLDELGGPGAIVDPACGAGALLLAAHRRWPDRLLVGVERDERLALACALRLIEARRDLPELRVRVIVGDGLAKLPDALEEHVAAVVMNPPYVPEKGNGAMLAEVAATHPRFEAIRGARVDLLYYFLARSVEMLPEGGQAAWLTPTHWLTADGAGRLRAWLLERGAMERFEWRRTAGVFDAAPGSEVLLSVCRKGPARRASLWRGAGAAHDPGAEPWRAVEPESLGPQRWRPRADAEVLRWGEAMRREGRPLGELVRDFQGVVSGADRVTRRHVRIFDDASKGWEVGAPIFLSETEEPPARWEPLLPYVRPVLRSGRLEASRVYKGDEVHAWMLYIDGTLEAEFEDAVNEVLGPYRAILERRREVKTGQMPWYRLHWPRDAEAMASPKLVVPRRAAQPCFALDLGGAVVSSDCTFLVAPPEVEDPRAYLSELMAQLNHEQSARYLREFGKQKGALLEFYSSPLRALPIVF